MDLFGDGEFAHFYGKRQRCAVTEKMLVKYLNFKGILPWWF